MEPIQPSTKPNAPENDESGASQSNSVPISVQTSSTSTPSVDSASQSVQSTNDTFAGPVAVTPATDTSDAPATTVSSTTPTESIQPTATAPQPTAFTMPTTSGSDNAQAPVVVVGSSVEAPTNVPMAPVMGANGTPPMGSKGKKRWVLPVAALATLAVLGGGAYAALVYMPNRPANVYNTGMVNSGKAVDVLVDYTGKQAAKKYTGYDYSVKMDGESAGTTASMSLDSSVSDDGNGTATMTANIMGQKINAEARTIAVKDSKYPDMYMRVSGVKNALDAFDMPGSAVENQWIVVDHTLIGSFYDGVREGYQQSSGGSPLTTPTTEQVQDALAKMQQANKDYLFTKDDSKAVLQNKKFIGKETVDGRSVYHYTVGYSKDHMVSYVTAVGKALDSSKLNAWAKDASGGDNISKAIALDDLKDSIKDSKGTYTFDMWIDAKTKLMNSVRFTDPEDKSTSITIAQGYTGSGTSYPFTISMKNDEGSGSIGFTLDTSANKVSGTLKLDAQDTKANGSFSITPTTKSVEVTAPTGAKSLESVLKTFGLSQDSLLQDSSMLSENSLLGSSL